MAHQTQVHKRSRLLRCHGPVGPTKKSHETRGGSGLEDGQPCGFESGKISVYGTWVSTMVERIRGSGLEGGLHQTLRGQREARGFQRPLITEY